MFFWFSATGPVPFLFFLFLISAFYPLHCLLFSGLAVLSNSHFYPFAICEFFLFLLLSFAKLPFYAFIYSRLPFFRLFPLLGFIFCFPIDSVSSFCFRSYQLPFSFFILYQSSLFFCTPFCPFPAFSFGFISCQTAFCIFHSAIFYLAISPVKSYAVYASAY